MKTTFALLGAFALTTAFAGNAAAPTVDELDAGARSVVVHFGDLDLTDPQGAATLYRRLQHAARSVCPDAGRRDLYHLQIAQQCYDEAIGNAVARIDRPMLSSQHRRLTGQAG